MGPQKKYNLEICPVEKCFKYFSSKENGIQTYPLDVENMDNEMFTKLEGALKELFEKTELGNAKSFNLIIPNDYYALTSISVPKLNKQLSLQNIKTELQARFANVNDLEFEFFLINSTQESNLYLIRYIRKDVISSFHKLFSGFKMELSSIMPRSLAVQKNLLLHEPKLKQRIYVLIELFEQSSYLSVFQNLNLLQYYQFDFGTNILSTSKVFKEESLYNHKPAQLAVMRARAAAKAKKGIPDDIVTADDDEGTEDTDLTDEFEIIMKNWDNYVKQVQNVLDNDFFYRNDIKFDDVIFVMPKDLHYLIDNTTLESEFDESGMEVKRKKKVVNNRERRQPYAKKPQLRKRIFATFTKQDKKSIQLRVFDFNDLAIGKK